MYKEFPTLYKLNSTGNIQEWEIWTQDAIVHTVYGVSGGSMQNAAYVAEAKNFGRSNYTTAEEQATLEAQSKWEHQTKYNGYFETIEEAQKATNHRMPAGGYKPMKAHKYEDHKHKLSYPLCVQPKIDGMRCIAVRDNDIVTLFASSGREIMNLQHIKTDLLWLMKDGDVLDGELYCHGMPLNQILSIVKREVNQASIPEQSKILYHVFDLVDFELPFYKRHTKLAEMYEAKKWLCANVKKVNTQLVYTTAEAEKHYYTFIELGYEGMMYRNYHGLYQQKRSYDILKRKDFKEEEFLIVGVEDGKGNASGLAVNFICALPNGETFKAPINGTEEYRIDLFNDVTLWEGKYATVRFLNYSEYGVPVIPKCIAMRDEKGVD